MDQYLLREYGCVSPFHTNKPNETHCKANKDLYDVYANIRRTFLFKCRPCARMTVFFQIPIIQNNSDIEGFVKFYFKDEVKVSTEKLKYTIVSFMAEVGGYVGLLLGVSLLDITSIIGQFFAKICQKQI